MCKIEEVRKLTEEEVKEWEEERESKLIEYMKEYIREKEEGKINKGSQ